MSSWVQEGAPPRHATLDELAGPRNGRRHQATTSLDRALLSVVVLVFGLVGWQAVRIIEADYHALKPRALVRAWADDKSKWTPATWVEARDGTLAALQVTPDNPALHDQMAVIYQVRARDARTSAEMQRLFYSEAARWQRSSLALRPGHGWTWVGLAEALQFLSPGSQEAWHAWRQASRFTPHEMTVQPNLYALGFANWQSAPADVKAWMRATYAEARPAQRKRIDATAAGFRLERWQAEE